MAQAVQQPPLLRGAARLLQVFSAVSPATAYGIRFGLVVAAAVAIGKLPGNPVIPLTAAQAATGVGPFEGIDVVNLGSDNVSGNTILTFAVGARIPFTKNLSFGTIYKFPMTSRRHIHKQRVTMSLLFEF